MQTQNTTVRLADGEDLTFRDLAVPYAAPTGAQILEAANAATADAVLLQRLPSGDLEAIRSTEQPDLAASVEFILSFGDRTYSMAVDHAQLVWAARHISGEKVRKLAKVPDTHELLIVRNGSEPTVVDQRNVVDLARPGVEKFVTRPKSWKLRVQAVTLEFTVSEVKVSDAMTKAGFDPSVAWNIFVIVAGQPKKQVDVNFVVDLTTPGIERIRLMRPDVNNGESTLTSLRREFRLLDADVAYLEATGFRWETIERGGKRWLLIHGYPLPAGYKSRDATLALDIPPTYPQAHLDMFYLHPRAERHDGAAIPSTESTADIEGATFQRWSRHRQGVNVWDPRTDNVATHLTLVDDCLLREFGE